MNFSNIIFLYYFLPCFFLIYFIVPSYMKNLVLLLGSIFFYAWGEPRFVFCMLFIIIIDFNSALFIERYRNKNTGYSKAVLIGALVINIGLLGYFKYFTFFMETFHNITKISIPIISIALPIGISFYTFQSISYLVDVYRGDVNVQHNLIDFAAYIAAFPQLIAGPIVRLTNIETSLHSRQICFEHIAPGIRRFIIGLSKKVLIADSFGALCDIFINSNDKSIVFYWVYAISFTLQIYYDFSGYSDMAIGLGKILGFDYPENFYYPYISSSITEFWRRWHISLGSWFRDYVYIPLGGNRVKKSRWIGNILLVWMLTGLWHGASWNFVLWGLLYGILLLVEKLFLLKYLKKSKFFSHIYVLFFVVTGFVIFQAGDIPDAFYSLKNMFCIGNLSPFSTETGYYIRSYFVLFLAAILGCTPIVKKGIEILCQKESMQKVCSLFEIPFLMILLILVTAYLVDGSFSPFLYFRF